MRWDEVHRWGRTIRVLGMTARVLASALAAAVALVAGADDEQFFADRHAAQLTPARKDLSIDLEPGLGHLGMLTKPAGIAAVSQVFVRLTKD